MATRKRNENVVLILELDCGDCSKKEIFLAGMSSKSKMWVKKTP